MQISRLRIVFVFFKSFVFLGCVNVAADLYPPLLARSLFSGSSPTLPWGANRMDGWKLRVESP